MRTSHIQILGILLAIASGVCLAHHHKPGCGSLGPGNNPCTCAEVVVKAAKLSRPLVYASPQAINQAALARSSYAYSGYGGAAGYSNGYRSGSYRVPDSARSYSRYHDRLYGVTDRYGNVEVVEDPNTKPVIVPSLKPVGDLCNPIKEVDRETGAIIGKVVDTVVTPAYPGKVRCENKPVPVMNCLDLLRQYGVARGGAITTANAGGVQIYQDGEVATKKIVNPDSDCDDNRPYSPAPPFVVNAAGNGPSVNFGSSAAAAAGADVEVINQSFASASARAESDTTTVIGGNLVDPRAEGAPVNSLDVVGPRDGESVVENLNVVDPRTGEVMVEGVVDVVDPRGREAVIAGVDVVDPSTGKVVVGGLQVVDPRTSGIVVNSLDDDSGLGRLYSGYGSGPVYGSSSSGVFGAYKKKGYKKYGQGRVLYGGSGSGSLTGVGYGGYGSYGSGSGSGVYGGSSSTGYGVYGSGSGSYGTSYSGSNLGGTSYSGSNLGGLYGGYGSLGNYYGSLSGGSGSGLYGGAFTSPNYGVGSGYESVSPGGGYGGSSYGPGYGSSSYGPGYGSSSYGLGYGSSSYGPGYGSSYYGPGYGSGSYGPSYGPGYGFEYSGSNLGGPGSSGLVTGGPSTSGSLSASFASSQASSSATAISGAGGAFGGASATASSTAGAFGGAFGSPSLANTASTPGDFGLSGSRYSSPYDDDDDRYSPLSFSALNRDPSSSNNDFSVPSSSSPLRDCDSPQPRGPVPIDPVSLSLAYKHVVAPIVNHYQRGKYVPEDKLAFGHRTLPAEYKVSKTVKDIPEEKLLTSDRPVIELSVPSSRPTTIDIEDTENPAELEAFERERLEVEAESSSSSSSSATSLITYGDLGFRPVQPKPSSPIWRPVPVPSEMISPIVSGCTGGCGPLGPPKSDYVPGNVYVQKRIFETEVPVRPLPGEVGRDGGVEIVEEVGSRGNLYARLRSAARKQSLCPV